MAQWAGRFQSHQCHICETAARAEALRSEARTEAISGFEWRAKEAKPVNGATSVKVRASGLRPLHSSFFVV